MSEISRLPTKRELERGPTKEGLQRFEQNADATLPTLEEARQAADHLGKWITTPTREAQNLATMIIVIEHGWSPETGQWFRGMVREMPGQSLDPDDHPFRIAESDALCAERTKR